MRVRVIQNKCETVGICVKACPDIFRFQEGSKKATVIVDKVPSHLEQKCLKAVDLCPNRAIVVFL
jgi:ferredoxin